MKVQMAFYLINIILPASKYKKKIHILLRFEVSQIQKGYKSAPFTSITLLFCFKINKTLNN